ncbi:complement factor D [Anolis sagrei]|uniref:complement factor D n=1 Tax=Anolis sagrei TaxID=38937 RepID=UPI0035225F48
MLTSGPVRMLSAIGIILFCSAICAYGRPRGRILGGRDATPHTMPYMASLQEGGKHICGGFLIAQEWVLSAAHCLEDTNNGTFQVLLGAHSLTAPEPNKRLYCVRRLVAHPGSSVETNEDDLLLIQLAEPAVLGPDVKTLALQNEDQELPAGTFCLAAGWGYTKNTRQRPDVLQSAELPIMSRSECNERRFHDGEITQNMMCTEIKSVRRDTCKGDSGGPLVCHGVAEGVVTAGSRVCGNWRKPGIYTRIAPYLPWINSTMASPN